MKEILFRAKNSSKDWVYGLLDSFYQNPTTKYYTIHNCETDDTTYSVDEKTIGQYTGLKDKNGTKIFKGDIVELHDRISNIHWTAIVEFGNPNSEYSWGWQLNPLKTLYPTAVKEFYWNKNILCWVEMEGVLCEVIGNIHDNPELFGG